jgi:hypothetical protein
MHASIRTSAGLLLTCAVAACAREPITGSFVAMLGSTDTIAVESYTRSGDNLNGSSTVAYPRASMRAYEVSFGPGGEVMHVHLASGAPGGQPTTVADFTYMGDSVAVEVRRDTTTERFVVATEGERPLPFYEDLFVFWELSLAQAMEAGADTATIGALAGRTVLPIGFDRVGAGAADFSFPEWGTVHASMAGDRLESLDMTGTTSKYTVARVPSVDVEGAATAWASRPQPGALSPRDTASATVGAAHVAIDYGRPSMRGRKVFGGIVPWGEVWRLGANAATQLITDRALVIGGTLVPAGTYSLWCVPTSSEWTLVVNAQHGQWGTQHDASQDIARIPLGVSAASAPIEQLTIEVADGGGGKGTIALEWETTRASVPFTVR